MKNIKNKPSKNQKKIYFNFNFIYLFIYYNNKNKINYIKFLNKK